MVRFKNRYLLFELIWKDGKVDLAVSEANLLGAIRDSVQTNFGDFGLGTSLASLQVKFYNPVTSTCVVRCGRDQHRQVMLVDLDQSKSAMVLYQGNRYRYTSNS